MSPVPPPSQFASSPPPVPVAKAPPIPPPPPPAPAAKSLDEPDVVGSARQSFASKAKSSASKFFSYSKAAKSETIRQGDPKPIIPPVSYTPVKLEDPTKNRSISSESRKAATAAAVKAVGSSSSKSSSTSLHQSRSHSNAEVTHYTQDLQQRDKSEDHDGRSGSNSSRKGAVKAAGSSKSSSSSLHQSRYQSHVDGSSKYTFDSNEADKYIEQLMREAETDPKLRELTYGTPPAAEAKPPKRPPSPQQAKPSLNA